MILKSMRPDLPTGTVTFLFTDIEGSTRLLHELGPLGQGDSGSANPQGYDAPVAVTLEPKLDAQRIRADFAYLDELVNGKPFAYLDSAVSTQKPRQCWTR